MRNVVYLSLLIVVTVLSFSRCTKDDVISNQFKELVDKDAVKIIDGILTFKDDESFQKRLKLIQEDENNEENLKWNESINFKSINYWFHEANKETCCGKEINEKEFSDKYKDFVEVTIDEDSELEISPKFLTPTLNWVINEEGEVVIGDTKIIVTKSHVISIQNYDTEKVKKAFTTLKSDFDDGIFIHEILMPTAKTFCFTSFGEEHIEQVSVVNGIQQTGLNFNKLKVDWNWINESYLSNSTINFLFGQKLQMKSKGRNWRNLGIWRCDDGFFNWNTNLNIFHNIPNVPSIQIQNNTVALIPDCRLTRTTNLLNHQVPWSRTNLDLFDNLWINIDLVDITVNYTRDNNDPFPLTNSVNIFCD